MSIHSDTLSCSRANQSLLLLFNAVCLMEKQQIPFYSLWFEVYVSRTMHTNVAVCIVFIDTYYVQIYGLNCICVN